MAFYHLLPEVTQPHFLHVVTVTTRPDRRGQRFRILPGGTSDHWCPGVEPSEFQSHLCRLLAGERGQVTSFLTDEKSWYNLVGVF